MMDNSQQASYIIHPMLTEDAQEIVKWHYAPPYSFYNMSDDPEDTGELLNGTYYSVKHPQEGLVGFFCYGASAQVNAGAEAGLYSDQAALDIGLGMKPERTGQGAGSDFLKAGLNFGQHTFEPGRFRLSVAAFNRRAIAVYKKAGFLPIGTFVLRNDGKETEFIVMVN